MITYICSKCNGEFDGHEASREHFKQCEEIPDCNRCGASFEDKDSRHAHVYDGGCPVELELPPQPPQDRIHAHGKYQGHTRRVL